ncbi:MAG: DUF167 domain-containing protein [Alphaproteobacteria bacterium]|nr:MAG: DUF167 domain-containing protein [Alphaproteobacteria bacterium]
MIARPPWTATADSVVVTVRLTPRGGRDAIDGVAQLADGRSVLKVRVRAAASEGEANAALMKLIAKTLGVAGRDVSLVAGASARLKHLRISGAGATLAATLEKICAMG